MAAQTPIPGCTYHPGMGFIYICQTCDNELLCTDCVVSRHKFHDIGKLTDYVSEQKQQIQKYEEKLSKTDIPKLDKQILEGKENLKKSSAGLKKMMEDIKRQGEQIKTEADNLVDKLVNICKYLMKINEDITEKNTVALTKVLGDELKPQLERCQQVLASGSNNDVISVARETRNTSTAPPDLRTLKTAVFKPGVIYNDLLERMLGTVLVDGENALYKPIPSHTVIVSSYQTSFPYNACRTCLPGDNAWVSYWDKDMLRRIDQKGNIKEKVNCKVKVCSIAVSPTTGTVWFCVSEDKSIREVVTNGAAVTRFTVDGKPWSLCITQEDMVVVGIALSGIVMYTTDGREVSDGAGCVCRQEAVVPHHMAYCRQTGDIAAADSDGVSFDNYMAGKKPGKEPRVIVMDKHLKLKFECKNLGGIKSQLGAGQQSKFFPWDVCFDGTGDVLVMDRVTRSVVLIDGNSGHLLRTVYHSNGSAPNTVSLQGDHTLWIGHRDRTMKIIKYK